MTAAEQWWMHANAAAAVTAFLRAESQTDTQRTMLARTVTVPQELLLPHSDDVCPSCGHEIDSTTCHCGSGENWHSDHTFVPKGCTCGYWDEETRRRIPPCVP